MQKQIDIRALVEANVLWSWAAASPQPSDRGGRGPALREPNHLAAFEAMRPRLGDMDAQRAALDALRSDPALREEAAQTVDSMFGRHIPDFAIGAFGPGAAKVAFVTLGGVS